MGTMCSQPRQEEPVTRASIIFKHTYKNVTFENISGDICNQTIDAIVNPANNQLAHNNSLANSIVVKGGQIIQEESDKIMDDTDGILEIGTAVVTTAGKLQAKHIIHVVSPIWSGGQNGEMEKLAVAVHNCLTKADENKIGSIAVPCLSGGSFGFPREQCAEIMVKSCIEFLDKNPETSVNLIKFVNMDTLTVRAFKAELERVMKNGFLPTQETRTLSHEEEAAEPEQVQEETKPVQETEVRTEEETVPTTEAQEVPAGEAQEAN